MADDGENLVSNVELTGVDKTLTDLKRLGDTAEVELAKLSTAAKGAGAAIGKAGSDVAAGLKKMDGAGGFNQLTPQQFNNLRQATEQFVRSVQKGVKDVVDFGVKTAKLGAIALRTPPRECDR